MKDQAKVIVALLAGAAVGAAVALLLAPSSGSELREDIADYVDDLVSSARNKAESAASSIREYGSNTLEKSKSKFRSAVDELSNYKDGVVDSIKSKAKSGADELKDSIQDA
ncbi:MAG: YtxH domain-containing protein [Mucilaginibacter sp.]|nr:YtxH domain-containing protein [Mucilaginibacter sp.]